MNQHSDVENSEFRKVNDFRSRMTERRRWVRFILPDLVTRLSWKRAGTTEAQLVELVDVSGEIAAVLLDFEPHHHVPYMLHFHNGKSDEMSVPAQLIATKATEQGKILATFKFEVAGAPTSFLPKQRERRAWERRVPKEKAAVLCWAERDCEVSVNAEVLNLSGGGAAVRLPKRPPANETLWLSVGQKGRESEPVECKTVSSAPDGKGAFTLRLSFVGLCPMQVFEVAMGLDT